MSRIEQPADLLRGAERLDVPAARASNRTVRARVATFALAVIGLVLGFVSGVALIFATGLVEFC